MESDDIEVLLFPIADSGIVSRLGMLSSSVLQCVGKTVFESGLQCPQQQAGASLGLEG